MATQKPKIQGYIEQTTFDRFEAYRQESGLSQSQALEKILSSFFGSEQQDDLSDRFESLCQYAEQEFKKLQERIAMLEITSESPSNLPEITSELPSESSGNPPSEPLEITSELPSELPEITSELPSELPEITSELPSESSGNPPSEPLEITSELPSELPEITSELPSESPKLVVCKLYKNNAKDPQSWRYWTGTKAGFVEDLSKAKTYTEKGSTKVINQLLADELHKPTSRERISCRALEELLALSEKYSVIC